MHVKVKPKEKPLPKKKKGGRSVISNHGDLFHAIVPTGPLHDASVYGSYVVI